jgi:uncharacterized protein YkwD
VYLVVFALVAASLAATASPSRARAMRSSAQKTVTSPLTSRQLLTLINAFRLANGRSALRFDRHLMTAAAWMAKDEGKRNLVVLDHTDSKGRGVPKRDLAFGYASNKYATGENLAGGSVAAKDTFAQFKGSTVHRRNMLRSSYRAVGIARVQVPGSRYQWYWVVDFGTRVTKAQL